MRRSTPFEVQSMANQEHQKNHYMPDRHIEWLPHFAYHQSCLFWQTVYELFKISVFFIFTKVRKRYFSTDRM